MPYTFIGFDIDDGDGDTVWRDVENGDYFLVVLEGDMIGGVRPPFIIELNNAKMVEVEGSKRWTPRPDLVAALVDMARTVRMSWDGESHTCSSEDIAEEASIKLRISQ